MILGGYMEEVVKKLKLMAAQLRIDTINAVHHAKSGHPGGSLSAADIIAALYFYKMRVNPAEPDWDDRDRFVLSKGHAAPILYAALARRGFFYIDELYKLRHVSSFLQGAPSLNTPGIDMTAGPLGQGLSAAVGISLAGKYKKKNYNTFVIIGDGEMQEGQIWEAAMAAAKFKLSRLVCFLDHNKIQMCGRIDDIMPVDCARDKMSAFGWEVKEINGHNMIEIVSLLDSLDTRTDQRPLFVVAHTVKGKGVSYMEDTFAWHGGVPNDEQYAIALKELEESKK